VKNKLLFIENISKVLIIIFFVLAPFIYNKTVYFFSFF